MAPPSPVLGDGGVPVSVGGSLSSAVAMFSSYGPTHAVSTEGSIVRLARILPVGTHLSYRRLFQPHDIYHDAAIFSAHKENTGMVFEIDTGGTPVVLDSYVAPVRLQLFPQERFAEGLRAPETFWRDIARRLSVRGQRFISETQDELFRMADRYAGMLFGENDIPAPFINQGIFSPDYQENASVAIARDSLRYGLVPAAASRIAGVQLARFRTDQPLLERPEVTDLVARLNREAWPSARPVVNAWQKERKHSRELRKSA